MKTDGVIFQLSEARKHLDDLIQELRDGKLTEEDDSSLQVHVEHILNHLCFAWSGRDLSVTDYNDLTQEDFERHCHTVPNLYGPRTLDP